MWHNLPSGGGKRALFDHVKGLAERGHYVEAWSPPTIDHDYLPLAPYAKQHIVEMRWPIRKTVSDRTGLTSYTARTVRAMDDHCARCVDQMSAGAFDILFANSCHQFATTAIGRLSPLPSALYLQEPYRTLYEASPHSRWAARPPATGPRAAIANARHLMATRNSSVLVREEIANARTYRKILCNSYFSRESIWRAYGLDSEVCYLGADVALFKNHRLEREGFVVGFGSITRAKNLDLCIRAIAAMPRPWPRLVWIGNSTSIEVLEGAVQLAAKLGVAFEPRIRIDDAEVVSLLNRAMAMIYAPRLEPFGLAPIEAGACGVPVVAIAEGGVRETIIDGQTGLVADPTPKALAAALHLLRSDPALARRLGEAASSTVREHWSVHAATDRLIVKLADVLAA